MKSTYRDITKPSYLNNKLFIITSNYKTQLYRNGIRYQLKPINFSLFNLNRFTLNDNLYETY